MSFFGIGFGEILLILVIALIIWGPGKMIDLSKTVGKMVYNLKKSTSDLTKQITSEAEDHDKNISTPKIQPAGKQENK